MSVLPKEYPDNHDAELVLRLYDLRRETVMRESRGAVNAKYWPKNAQEAVAVLKTDHPQNAAFRQVMTYWEMAYAMVKWGVLHADFMMESSSEGLLLFAKVHPWLKQIREQTSPGYFANAEWVVANTDSGRRAFERYAARVKKSAESR